MRSKRRGNQLTGNACGIIFFFWEKLSISRTSLKIFLNFAHPCVRNTVVLKSLNPVTFLSNFWLLFCFDLIFSLYILFFYYSPNRTCAKMQHALHYQSALRMLTFFFQHCLNSAWHGVNRLSDHFCFLYFSTNHESHLSRLFGLLGLCFTFSCFKCSQKCSDGFNSGDSGGKPITPKSLFVLPFLSSFLRG